MADLFALIAEMAAVSPGRDSSPTTEQLSRLRELTALLIDADEDAAAEYERFVGVRERCLDYGPAEGELGETYGGKRMLVTGGTGCIGARLIQQLRALGVGELVSVSRGRREFTALPGVEYRNADVRDTAAMHEVMDRVRPDVVFHLAAQRDPGKAEHAVVETVTTNAVGTMNVLRAARASGVRSVLHASTGKAMRYHTRDVYAATKKLGEWLLCDYAHEGRHAGGARFTHVVDNSIVLRNFELAMSGGVLRVHDPKIEFYAQSALESAQLLVLAGIGARPGFSLNTIRDLDAPVRLLSMALGLVGRRADPPPLWFTGCDPGYEDGFQPGLYDPRTALEVSPLINALEARSTDPLASVPAVDRFTLCLPAGGEAEAIVEELDRECERGDPRSVLEVLNRASQRMARATYASADPTTLRRMHEIAERSGRPGLPCAEELPSAPATSADDWPEHLRWQFPDVQQYAAS